MMSLMAYADKEDNVAGFGRCVSTNVRVVAQELSIREPATKGWVATGLA